MNNTVKPYVLIVFAVLIALMLAGYFAIASQASQPPFP